MLNFLTCISATLSKQAVKALARLCVYAWADPEGGGALGPPPHEKSCPDPLKNHKVTKSAFNVGPSSVQQRNVI